MRGALALLLCLCQAALPQVAPASQAAAPRCLEVRDGDAAAVQALGGGAPAGPGPLTFPLLPARLCAELIRQAEAAAAAQGGWSSDRHARYATTDLEVRKVPGLWALIEPHLERASRRGWEVASRSAGAGDEEPTLHLHDLFVVRYDVQGQRSLDAHKDGSRATFQAALNEEGVDFEGGGTLFESLGCWVQPPLGGAMVFPGHLVHSAREITVGRRYVLVGFSHRDGGNAEDEHFALSFGAPFRVGLLPAPCLGPGGEVVATLAWEGCPEDEFAVLAHKESNASATWLWLERRPQEPCRAGDTRARQERPLELPSTWAWEAEERGPLMALPPGHQYSAYALRPCGPPMSRWGEFA